MVFNTGTKKTLIKKLRNMASSNTLPLNVNFSKTNKNELLDTNVIDSFIFRKVFKSDFKINNERKNFFRRRNVRVMSLYRNSLFKNSKSNNFIFKNYKYVFSIQL